MIELLFYRYLVTKLHLTLKEKWAFNPFAGVLENDLEKIIIAKFDVESMLKQIQQSESIAIEFVGRQGRGKTSNLMYLQKQIPQYPIFLLNANTKAVKLFQNKSEIVFVDSIHHLSIFDRLKLFRTKKVIVYTTHWSRKLECILVGKKHQAIRFKGITKEVLRRILNKRLQFAAINKLKPKDKFTDQESYQLIQQFGDNYRGIINHLYEKYQ